MLALLVASLAVVTLCAPATPVRAASIVSVDAAMTKGPADAPVLIVEFSDFQ